MSFVRPSLRLTPNWRYPFMQQRKSVQPWVWRRARSTPSLSIGQPDSTIVTRVEFPSEGCRSISTRAGWPPLADHSKAMCRSCLISLTRTETLPPPTSAKIPCHRFAGAERPARTRRKEVYEPIGINNGGKDFGGWFQNPVLHACFDRHFMPPRNSLRTVQFRKHFSLFRRSL